MRADYPRVTHPCATLLETEASFAFDLHVLSTPPAFNLSQNQTLQFKSVSRFLLGRNQNLKDSFFPLAIHLSMNHPRASAPLPPFSAARCRFMHHTLDRVNNFFFVPAKFFSPGPQKAQRCCSVAGSGRYPSTPHLSTLFCKKVVRQPGISPQSHARKRLAGNYT